MIINNQQEYEDFFPYDKKYIKVYPTQYPCYCKMEFEGGGLMGDYKQVYVAYFPKNVSVEEAFVLGLKQPFEPIINK